MVALFPVPDTVLSKSMFPRRQVPELDADFKGQTPLPACKLHNTPPLSTFPISIPQALWHSEELAPGALVLGARGEPRQSTI